MARRRDVEVNTDQAARPSEGIPFRCSNCAFECVADFLGRTPPWNRSICFIEEAYIVRDPLGDMAHPVCIGAACAACSKPVCAMPSCSLFYAKRICVACAHTPAVQKQLPPELLSSIAPLQAEPG
jgi:hypothetical protein